MFRKWTGTALLLVSVAIAAVSAPSPAFAEKRVALVIGNNVYPKLPADRQLGRAINDARAVKAALEKLGFTVTLGENLDRTGMVDQLFAFTRQIEPGDIALFYFAGHGVALGGGNYLLPTDIPLPQVGEEQRVRNLAIGEADIIADIEERKARVALLMLDACRDNPFRRPGVTRSVGSDQGLVRANEAADGVFAIYSAGFGQSALDRLGDDDTSPNSVFTRVLIPELAKPGLHLSDLAYEVREQVASLAASVGHQQVPAYYDQTRGARIYLAGLPSAGGSSGIGPDEIAWDYLRASNDPLALRKFMTDFPTSLRKAEAQSRIASLEQAGRGRAEASEAIRRQVARSVVTINGTSPAGGLSTDPVFEKFFGRTDSVAGKPVPSRASGAIVDPSGIIVTAMVAVSGLTDLQVITADHRTFVPEVLLKDNRNNIAVLRIGNLCETFPAIAMANSDDVRLGDAVVSVASPDVPTPIASMHIVSPISRAQLSGDYGYIQTDYTNDLGTGGGAVVDGNGRLLGIIAGVKYSGVAGVGFTIPVNGLKIALASVPTARPARRPWLGAKLQDMTAEIVDSLGLKRRTGVLVANVSAGGAAARAGLKVADVIVSVDNTAIADLNAFNYRFNTKPLCGQAELAIVRAGKDMKLAVALEPAPNGNLDELTIASKSPFSGAKVSNITPALAEDLSLDSPPEGAIIVEVPDKSPASSVGFQRGDIVVQVNNTKITNTRDLERVTSQPTKTWKITITRDGKTINVTLAG